MTSDEERLAMGLGLVAGTLAITGLGLWYVDHAEPAPPAPEEDELLGLGLGAAITALLFVF